MRPLSATHSRVIAEPYNPKALPSLYHITFFQIADNPPRHQPGNLHHGQFFSILHVAFNQLPFIVFARFIQ